jgi:triosephosphate isomerase
MYGETDDIVRAKLKAVLNAGLSAVVCVGESLEEREDGNHEAVVTRQLREALDVVPSDWTDRITVAYEPVWAIGTGRNATPEDASTMAALVQSICREQGLDDMQVLYGGSVNAGNAESLIASPGIGGFLVGGASLKADDFLAIVAAADV